MSVCPMAGPQVVEKRTRTLEEHHRLILEAAAAAPPAAEVDATILANLVRRRMVYGDVVQVLSSMTTTIRPSPPH